MKTKLSFWAFCFCSLLLFAACNNQQKQPNTSVNTLSKALQEIITQKYPNAKVLKVEKEKNGTEVDIQERNIHKEVWFDTKDQWVSTKWEISSRDVPVAVMEALASSAYNQYNIEDITVIERPSGLYYDFELKLNNNEVHLVLDSLAQVVIQ